MPEASFLDRDGRIYGVVVAPDHSGVNRIVWMTRFTQFTHDQAVRAAQNYLDEVGERIAKPTVGIERLWLERAGFLESHIGQEGLF